MNYADQLLAMLNDRLPMHAALAALREAGASPAEAAQAVTAITGYPAGDAALLVRQCGAWSMPRVPKPAAQRPSREQVTCHGRSGHGSATVLPYLVLPYVVRPGQGGTESRD